MEQKKQGKLVRSLTLTSATLLVVSSVIGSGVYKKVAPMAAGLLSPTLVLLAWVLAGVISLFGALSNAEIAGMLADSGGEYVYFKRIYGRFMSFIYGWSIFTTIKSAAVAGIAYVFAQSLNGLVALPHFTEGVEKMTVLGVFQPFDNFGVKGVAILLILGLTFLNTRGLKSGELVSRWITRLVVFGLSVVVLSGLLFGNGSFQNVTTVATPNVVVPAEPIELVAPVAQSWFNFGFIKAMFAAMLMAFWGYEGWNTVGYIGGEIQNPNRNLPLALFLGLLTIIVTYTLVNFTYLYVLPIDKIIDIHNAKNDIAAVAVVRSFAGETGAIALSFVILLTTLGCTNATILMPPRVYQAMAEDGLFFKSARDIHPIYNTPNNALWMQGIWSALLVLSGSFDQLTDMLIFAAFFFYGATAFGVFILRVREPNAERPYRVWGYPLVPALFVAYCVALIVITCINSPREATIGLALMTTGIPFYFYWNGKKS